MRGKKKKNANPITNPISNPITVVYHTYIHCWQLKFHIPNHFTLHIDIIYTNSILFCIGPDVNLDFFTSHNHRGIFDGGAPLSLREFHKKYRISMGKKLALVTNGLSG